MHYSEAKLSHPLDNEHTPMSIHSIFIKHALSVMILEINERFQRKITLFQSVIDKK